MGNVLSNIEKNELMLEGDTSRPRCSEKIHFVKQVFSRTGYKHLIFESPV